MKKIEDLIVWQKSRELVSLTYKIFTKYKDFGFRDQIQRAAVSIMNNIAEGFERRGDKEFRKFLYISKGSCGEVRSMLYVAKDLGYVSEEGFSSLYGKSEEISKLLSGLIKKMD